MYYRSRRPRRRQDAYPECDPGYEEGAEQLPQKPAKTALMTAADFLARQEHSEQKLSEKLLRKGYGQEEVRAAIETLKERHYLDDADACARQFAYFYEDSTKSVRQIVLKLRQRGFPKEVVQACVPEDSFAREKETCARILRLKCKPSADRQKLMAMLYRRGFDSSAIRQAVFEFMAEADR